LDCMLFVYAVSVEFIFFFFFQAEDGIRDELVTGVQTCALPISEKYSNHPTAKALAALAEEAGVPLTEPKNFAETAGLGVKAEVDGKHILIGRAQWLKDNAVGEDFIKSVDLNETEGFSLIFVSVNGKFVGW